MIAIVCVVTVLFELVKRVGFSDRVEAVNVCRADDEAVRGELSDNACLKSIIAFSVD